MGASASATQRPTARRDPTPVKDGDGVLFAVHPLSYEAWAEKSCDANGRVGLQVSEFGFRIVSLRTEGGENRRHVCKSFPVAMVRTGARTFPHATRISHIITLRNTEAPPPFLHAVSSYPPPSTTRVNRDTFRIITLFYGATCAVSQ